jgi:hypothetical protein
MPNYNWVMEVKMKNITALVTLFVLLFCFSAIAKENAIPNRVVTPPTPERATQSRCGCLEDRAESYTGVGFSYDFRGKGVFKVTDVFPGTPADDVGIHIGDFITKVDGVDFSEKISSDLKNTVRGEIGTHVELTIDRNGEILTVNPVRAYISIYITFNDGVREITVTDVNYGDVADYKLASSTITQNLPKVLTLAPNSPNPFVDNTTIKFALPSKANVQVDIYNAGGQLVRHLVNDSYDPGYHSATWDGNDQAGKAVSGGMYFFKMKAGHKVMQVKGLLLR